MLLTRESESSKENRLGEGSVPAVRRRSAFVNGQLARDLRNASSHNADGALRVDDCAPATRQSQPSPPPPTLTTTPASIPASTRSTVAACCVETASRVDVRSASDVTVTAGADVGSAADVIVAPGVDVGSSAVTSAVGSACVEPDVACAAEVTRSRRYPRVLTGLGIAGVFRALVVVVAIGVRAAETEPTPRTIRAKRLAGATRKRRPNQAAQGKRSSRARVSIDGPHAKSLESSSAKARAAHNRASRGTTNVAHETEISPSEPTKHLGESFKWTSGASISSEAPTAKAYTGPRPDFAAAVVRSAGLWMGGG